MTYNKQNGSSCPAVAAVHSLPDLVVRRELILPQG
jgi:hypothetical protein